jgi:NAD(P)-dependent dehydrogenase (short-subunit alcohol dehydrogenase family)
MWEGISGKRVVVTAGSAGIGWAITRAFVEAGAHTHICGLDSAHLEACKQTYPQLGVSVADVTDPAQVDALFDDVPEGFGGLDIPVNNAGISGPTGPIENSGIEDWAHTLDVNLQGSFYCLRRAIPLLKDAGGGSVVNISSTAGIMGHPLRTPYADAKWAVVGLTKSLAMEAGGHGIRVNAVCPGSVYGDRMPRVIASEAEARGEKGEAVQQRYPRQNSLKAS